LGRHDLVRWPNEKKIPEIKGETVGKKKDGKRAMPATRFTGGEVSRKVNHRETRGRNGRMPKE